MKSLDDGVMKKPQSPFTKNRTGKSIDFEAMIAHGDNPNGQTTIALTEVSRGGQSVGRPDWNYGCNADGRQWNSNPMLYKTPGYDIFPASPVVSSRKKKK